ncbi:hypothetical protein JK621_07860 [Serratia plymuthica]|uniref:hypothetical protein n=1 Tax=Serratia plymuthica TaxID=82996 RepID=UPI001BAE6D35|nr:hypothetical protein [Serratia plymuthica]QUY51190.1 hypothetical protein JK621_07860 [Serratia plymuthica]
MNDLHDNEGVKREFYFLNRPEIPKSDDKFSSLSVDCVRLKSLSDVGDGFGYGRTRFYQWCRGRGFLTLMNAPSPEMISRGYMVTGLSESGYPRVYVTEAGFNYVGGVFQDDIKKRMIKF